MKIILYTQPTCPQCNAVHIMLDKKNIVYDECQDLDIMKERGINHTPTLDVDGTLYTGSDLVKFIKGVN